MPVADWGDWRGKHRDGRVGWLPTRLPAQPKVHWKFPLPSKGLGGVAATKEYVLVSARELNDSTDAYYCIDANTGKQIWKHLNPATGELDYGNSPRATPVIHGKNVIVTGAFGQLHCLELATGKVVWELDIREDFGAKDVRKWGMCATPLLADDKLIINPGGKEASLVALNPVDSKVVWKSPGSSASYGNLIVATLGGKKQIVGFDLESLGGWDLATGKRLWKMPPEAKTQFNVPTPIAVDGKLLVAWEGNGTYLFGFGKDGVIETKPIAKYDRLAPDTHTPVVTAGRVFGAWNGLHCLDVSKKLDAVYVRREAAFSKYVTLVATDERVLAVTLTGELILFDAKAEKFTPIDRVSVLKDEAGCYAHPAFVGTRMYLRAEGELSAVELSDK